MKKVTLLIVLLLLLTSCSTTKHYGCKGGRCVFLENQNRIPPTPLIASDSFLN